MIETLYEGINLTCVIVYYCFYISCKTGQFLVTTINFALQNILKLFNSLLEVFAILQESFTIFSQDIVQGILHSLKIVSYIVDVTFGSIIKVFRDVANIFEAAILTVVAVYEFVVNFFWNIITLIGSAFIFLKRLIVLFGLGVWFSITLIPLCIVYLGTLCVYCVRVALDEIVEAVNTIELTLRNALKLFYEFVTDIPIESAVGILVTVCLIYILTQFYIIIYSYAYTQFQNVCSNIYRKLCQLNRRYLRSTVRRRPIVRIAVTPRRRIHYETEESRLRPSKNNADERYCVICQERAKCILALPCRHVCMCSECNDRLQLYNHTCPVCREDIESTMKIFV